MKARTLQMEVYEIVDSQRALADGTDKHGYIVRAKTESGDTIKLGFESEQAAQAAGFLWKTKVKVTIKPQDTLDDFEGKEDPEKEGKKKTVKKGRKGPMP